jgi:hypothetical protein
MTKPEAISASFRDPSGCLFRRDGVLYRQVNPVYEAHYERLMGSGLYDTLAEQELLIPHVEDPAVAPLVSPAYKVLRPEPLRLVSYPYEWCFSQLKDAALTTLRIQRLSLEHGMILKDASAYNIQFRAGKPVLIDTLSFETYTEGEPWVAYRQFCQHFMAPLALMSHTDVRLGQLFRVFLDGLPLDLASELLPTRTLLRFSLLAHVHLHGRAQRRFAEKAPRKKVATVSRNGLIGILDSLERGVRRLRWEPEGTEWADYYSDTNYSEQAWRHKQSLVADFVAKAAPRTVWDLGANTGEFSRIAADQAEATVAFDMDPAAVERNYRKCVEEGEGRILPLVLDLTNPSPAIGWANRERLSLFERGRADTALALALVHHLAIGNNLPFGKIGEFLAGMSDTLIIEFVPKSDSQVQRMLATRKDVFDDYDQHSFERALGEHFAIEESVSIADSERRLYLMRGEKSK